MVDEVQVVHVMMRAQLEVSQSGGQRGGRMQIGEAVETRLRGGRDPERRERRRRRMKRREADGDVKMAMQGQKEMQWMK